MNVLAALRQRVARRHYTNMGHLYQWRLCCCRGCCVSRRRAKQRFATALRRAYSAAFVGDHLRHGCDVAFSANICIYYTQLSGVAGSSLLTPACCALRGRHMAFSPDTGIFFVRARRFFLQGLPICGITDSQRPRGVRTIPSMLARCLMLQHHARYLQRTNCHACVGLWSYLCNGTNDARALRRTP